MENLLSYFLKVNGLIILFYLMYVVFLRKETFFASNRWYLISGLVLSLILPLITFTKTIWVEPTPTPEFYEEVIPIANNAIEVPIQENSLDWSLIITTTYVVISILLLIKITFELASFFNRIRKNKKLKKNDFVLIHSNTTENPFSFFHYIVINPNRFSKEEFQHILTHESIHVKQKHSFDVLLGKLFCAFFWVNPIIWLYRKAMLQNLEFIADSKTFQQIENKYEYQKTLLKVVTHQHDLSITNQFYQSLIKKRIVMLHTNQSHKKNFWKYATILPLLVGFMLLFQIETVAQVKENSQKVEAVTIAVGFVTDKNATDAEMKSDTEQLKKQGIVYKFSKIKRNKNGEIIAIKIEFNDGKGNKGVKEIKGDEPIEPIYFSAEEGRIGFTTEPDYSDYVVDEKLSKQFGTKIKVKMVKVTDDENLPNHPNEKQLFIINGKEYTSKELNGKKIETDGTIVHFFKDEAIKKFGEKGKNGVLIFEGKSIISEGDENQVFYKAKEIKSFKPKNIKLNFEKGKQYIISNKKYSFEELKDKDWWLFTGTNHKIEEKDGIVTIIGDVVENAFEWNTQDIVEVNTEDKKPLKYKLIELENGDGIVLFKDRIKFPGYPTHKIDEILFEFNGNKISDINLFTDENQIKSMDIIENKENQRIIRIIIKTK